MIFKEPSLRASRWFLISAACCFLITGFAKVFSVILRSNHTEIFDLVDPLLGFRFASLFLLIGGTEIAVGVACLMRIHSRFSIIITAILSANIAIYRLGLWLIEYKKPCTCLGTFTDALHISPETADIALKYVLIYLMFGSAFLFWTMPKSNKGPSVQPFAPPASPNVHGE